MQAAPMLDFGQLCSVVEVTQEAVIMTKLSQSSDHALSLGEANLFLYRHWKYAAQADKLRFSRP